MPARIDDEDLLADLREVGEALGRAPVIEEYEEHGEYFHRTFREHFGSWRDALEAAGLDPGSRRSQRGLRITCLNCEHTWEYTGDLDQTNCPECSTAVEIWRARIRRVRDHPVLEELSEGPKTRVELSTKVNQVAWPFVERLKTPKSGQSLDTPEPRVVLYLFGDDRAAVRKFIEVNEAYLSTVMDIQRNPLKSAWNQGLYELLVQQWEFRPDAPQKKEE